MIALALPMICLIHCAKPAPGTALENDTGHDVRIEITYRGADNKTVAVAGAGGRFALQQTADQIEAIGYSYEGHHCTLTHDQVAAAAAGKPSVVKLEPCG